MELDEYTSEFLSDAREHLDALKEGLLRLEKGGPGAGGEDGGGEPDDETVNALFRAFHTLKGNAGMLGYRRFAALAHALEDLL